MSQTERLDESAPSTALRLPSPSALRPGDLGMGTTALMLACLSGSFESVDACLNDDGEGVHVRSGNGRVALMFAAVRGDVRIARRLVDAGAKVDEQSDTGMTAFHYACEAGRRELAEFLLSKGADLHAQTKAGGTGLMFAALNAHLGLVRLLVSRGSDVRHKNHPGLDALLNACRRDGPERRELVVVLLAAGANIDSVDGQGRSAVALACRRGEHSLAKFLTARGANLLLADHVGNTALDACDSPQATPHPAPLLPLPPSQGPTRVAELLAIHDEYMRNLRWNRRWPCLSVLVASGYRPLRAAETAALAAAVPPSASVDPIDTSTPELKLRYLVGQVLGSKDLSKLIVLFL